MRYSGGRADLVVGEYVFTVAQAAADGTLNATRVQVSKDVGPAAAVRGRRTKNPAAQSRE